MQHHYNIGDDMSTIILTGKRACPREVEIVEKLLLQMKEFDPDLNLDTCNFNWMTRKDTLNINMQLDLFVSYDTVIEKNGIRKLSRHSFTTSYMTKVV